MDEGRKERAKEALASQAFFKKNTMENRVVGEQAYMESKMTELLHLNQAGRTHLRLDSQLVSSTCTCS